MGIFLFAGSPIVDQISSFNPYSLLHIPLYGVLTFLLIFSLIPASLLWKGVWASKPSGFAKTTNPVKRFLVAGLAALGVAILDEVHQFFIVSRGASITDVLLDSVGISLVLALILKIYGRTAVQ